MYRFRLMMPPHRPGTFCSVFATSQCLKSPKMRAEILDDVRVAEEDLVTRVKTGEWRRPPSKRLIASRALVAEAEARGTSVVVIEG